MKNPRHPLARVLQDAWQAVIENHCISKVDSLTNQIESPDVNTEAALQAYYFNEIRSHLKSAELHSEIAPGVRIFVEPNFRVGGETITPDLVACRNNQVICVIELKYLPRFISSTGLVAPSGFQKDNRNLKKLHYACVNQETPAFSHERYVMSTDQSRSEVFKMSRKTLFVWAGVYSLVDDDSDLIQIDQNDESKTAVPLLQIHTVFNANGTPTTEAFLGTIRK